MERIVQLPAGSDTEERAVSLHGHEYEGAPVQSNHLRRGLLLVAAFLGCAAAAVHFRAASAPTRQAAQREVVSLEEDPQDESCMVDEKCRGTIDWAMTEGIVSHPEWYVGLTQDSSPDEFQAVVYASGSGECPKPCPKKEKVTTRAPTSAPTPAPTEETPSPTPATKCSWAGDDCSETRCCAERACTWDFQSCEPMACYKKDHERAECRAECPEGWSCEVLGQTDIREELEPAVAGEDFAGTSLFCFAVVTSEAEKSLTNHQRQAGLGIFGCDDHLLLQGHALNGDAGHKSRVDSSIEHWEEIRKDGTYATRDWTVKVHADVVFFPDRLKLHLHKRPVVAQSKVYVENVDFKYKFMSALQVLSIHAAQLFLEHGAGCAQHLTRFGSEDYYLKACLDALGADHLSDFGLLQDRYVNRSITGCADGEAVGFHYYKQLSDWKACHEQATATAAQA